MFFFIISCIHVFNDMQIVTDQNLQFIYNLLNLNKSW